MRTDLPNDKASNFNARVRETLMTYLGRQGNPLDRGLTLRDLVESGIVKLDGPLRPGGSIPLAPGTAIGDTEVDLTPPPTPTGFTLTPGISYVFVEHDSPVFLQGGGYFRTRLYGATREPGAPAPVFADAIELAQYFGVTYAHPTNPATTWHMWIKWESNAGVLSVNPAGGTNGIAVTTGQDVTKLLEALTGEITQSQLFADLGARIDLIDASALVNGSVNNRLAAVEDLLSSRIDTVQAQVNDLTDTPTYNNATAYNTDDLVVYNGGIYRAKQPTTGNLPTNSTYWELIGNYTSLGAAVAAHTSQISTLNTGLAAEVSARTSLAAAVNDPTTGLAATRSLLTTSYYTKASTDSAIAAATLGMVTTTALNTALGAYTNTATLQQNYYTKTATDSAISTATTGLVSTTALNSALGAYTTTASLQQNYYTKTQADSAISVATTGLVSTNTLNTTLASYVTNATLTNQYYTKTQTDSAISVATTNLVSTTTLNTTLGSYVTNATLTNQYYTKTATDSAISSATTNLVSTTALNTALAAYPTTATLSANYFTKTETNSAISSATQNLVSTTALSTALGAYTTTASLQTNYYTKTQTDSAISSATSTLVSTTALNTALSAYTNTAALQQNYYTKTETNSAISSATSTLVSTTALNTALSSYTTTAALQQNYYTKTQTDSAISSSATTLTSQFNNTLTGYATTAAVQQSYYAKASGESLEGKYTVKVDLNGYVSGFGLASTANTATASSSFIVRADSFSVASPSGPGITPVVPFIVRTTQTTVNGVSVPPGVYINGAFIQGGSIQGASIAGGTIENSKLIDVSANKITGAALVSTSYIESAGYVAGTSGWKIHGNGTAEFAAASIRGQLTAAQIDSRGLSIKDANGNIILAAGTPLSTANISGLGSLATQSSVSTNQVTGLGTLATQNTVTTGQVTGLGSLATQNSVSTAQVTGLGLFATAPKLDSTNVSTYIANSSIGIAQIADTIQSTNFSSTAGWRINKAGTAFFNEVALRGSMNGGSFTGYAWPAAGQTGFHLGPSGLLIGNYNNGAWLQAGVDGYVSMPGLTISGGSASFYGSLNGASGTFSGSLTAQVVNTANIVGAAVTSSYVSVSYGIATSVTVTVPAGSAAVFISVGLGGYTYNNGKNSDYGTASGTLVINGTAEAEGTGAILWGSSNPTPGSYTVSVSRTAPYSTGVSYSGPLSLMVQVAKR